MIYILRQFVTMKEQTPWDIWVLFQLQHHHHIQQQILRQQYQAQERHLQELQEQQMKQLKVKTFCEKAKQILSTGLINNLPEVFFFILFIFLYFYWLLLIFCFYLLINIFFFKYLILGKHDDLNFPIYHSIFS